MTEATSTKATSTGATSTSTAQASAWLSSFDCALQSADASAALSLFDEECYWRDLVSFTWNIKTLEGKAEIGAMLEARLADVKPGHWQIQGEAHTKDGVVEAWLTFDTSVGRGEGHIRLRDGKCWTLFTTMTELKGFEEKKGHARIKGAEHGAFRNRKSWLERKNQEEAELGYIKQPYCVIIGGGQGGMGLGASLKRMGVPTIIIEKNQRAGDSWRNRYKSLCLHDPVWYDHMPYLPFPDDWPIFSPKDKIGDWLEMYTKVMELNYWHSTECKHAHYDEEANEWAVTVERAGETVTLRPKQLVLATGMSGMPNYPKIAGSESFKGTLIHSSQYGGGHDYSEKNCLVLGSNNSAHDICADLWEHGADVTMIQRSSTHISRSETLMDLRFGTLYSESAVQAGITTEKADMTVASMPFALMAAAQIPMARETAKRDADFYERLAKAGFLHDFGEDGSGLGMKYLRRGSGYYIDVGASGLIIDGSVKLKSRVTIERIKEHSVVLTDGTELPADVIIYATGFGSMNEWAARLISDEVADKVGICWGIGSATAKDPGPWEGELRNMWKPTQQAGLWFHGGNLAQSRYYSQFLALQIKARMEGIPTPVYGLSKVHHLR
jgi:putative flavoprotein involved in K+ transport